MARPKNSRRVERAPGATFFTPCGVPLTEAETVTLTVEGLEALRLSELEGLNASDAAGRCGVSRHAYERTLAEARRTVAEALVKGRILRIEGGSYELMHAKRCPRLNRRNIMSIVAISAEGPSVDDAVDPRYGRAGGFVLAAFPHGDLSLAPSITYLDNGDAQIRATGAGIATTEHLADAGVSVVISGYVGPKAFEALQAAGITVIQDMDGMTVGQALEKYRAGKCQAAAAPNHEAGNPLDQH